MLQVPLDLVFSEGDEIAFSCVGGVVHLTGYLVPNEDDFGGFGEEGDSDLELGDEEEEQVAQKPNKKLQKLLEAAGQEDSDDVDSDVDENGLDEEEGEEDSDEEDDDDDEEIEDEDSEEEDDEVVEPVAKKQKQQNGTAVNGKAAKAEAAKPAAAPAAAAKPKLVQGVTIEDIRVGKGVEAKQGRTVNVSSIV